MVVYTRYKKIFISLRNARIPLKETHGVPSRSPLVSSHRVARLVDPTVLYNYMVITLALLQTTTVRDEKTDEGPREGQYRASLSRTLSTRVHRVENAGRRVYSS